jgi:hypothetical protein
MRLPDTHFFSPIGSGIKYHIFKKDFHDRALCGIGPAMPIYYSCPVSVKEVFICKNCLQEWEKGHGI